MSQIAQLQHDVKGVFKRIECKNRAANKEKRKQNGVFCIKILQGQKDAANTRHDFARELDAAKAIELREVRKGYCEIDNWISKNKVKPKVDYRIEGEGISIRKPVKKSRTMSACD